MLGLSVNYFPLHFVPLQMQTKYLIPVPYFCEIMGNFIIPSLLVFGLSFLNYKTGIIIIVNLQG